MISWEDLVREPQARAIKLIKENIKPGKPLMVLGLPGCGKFEMTRKAIEELALQQFTYEILGIQHEPNVEFDWTKPYDEFIKTVSGNGVLVIDRIDSANPNWMSRLLMAAKHPDIPVVFIGTGSRNTSMILAMKCKVLKFTNDFPAELLEIE